MGPSLIFESANELERKGDEFVMITLIKVIASAPQVEGAKCLVTKDGLYAGTVGGGKVEARAIQYAQELLETKGQLTPEIKEWNLQKDIGMTCGGVCHFLFEKIIPQKWKIAIFGAGHVSQALSRILLTLKCDLTVIDDRKEWLDKLPKVKTICSDNHQEIISKFDKDTFFISMTKGHAFDVPFLVEIFKQFPNAPYIGAIGSKAKRNAIIKDLKEQSVSDEFIQNLHIPLGLPIGNNEPNEIAISIAAELIQIRDSLA